MKKSILKNLTQIFLIVFSVVLGLFLSERIEEIKKEKEASKLLSRIKPEIKVNKKIVEDWAPYHKKMSQKLNVFSNDKEFIKEFIKDKSVLYKKVLTEGTFMSIMPTNDTWDIAKSHPLTVNFDYDELLMISKLYNQQKLTFEPTQKIAELFISPDMNSKKNAKYNLEVFTTIMHEIVSREQQLIIFYKEADKILNLQEN